MANLSRIGKYLIRRELGKGAMGVVYEGFDPVLERIVAIKTILPKQLDSEHSAEVLARFKREAQAAGRLNHPGIVAVYDYGEVVAEDDSTLVAASGAEDEGAEKVAYIAMEFVKGRELRTYFDTDQRFALREVGRLMEEMLSALGHAHSQGVVHRDMKPANLIVLEDGRVKIADFGIARIEKSELTQAGTVMGTPSYMSPEQFMGQTVDGRSDLFSCGVILYQFLTGEKPFTGTSTTIMFKVLREEPLAPSMLNVAVPSAFDAVVKKALAKSPDERYQTAAEFAAAVRAAVSGSEIKASASDPSTEATVMAESTFDGTGQTLMPSAPLPRAPAASAPAPSAAPAPAAATTLALAQIPGARPASNKGLLVAVAAVVLATAVGAGLYVAFGAGKVAQAPALAGMSAAGGGVAAPAAAPAPVAAPATAAVATASTEMPPAATDPPLEAGTIIVSALGLVDPKDPRFKGDVTAAQAEARADAKRQLVEKVLALNVEGGSLNKNYALIEKKLLAQPGAFIKTVLREGAPTAGKDGLIETETRAVVKVREVQKSLNQLSKEERIDFIRNNGDPKVSIQMTLANADTALVLLPTRSQLAENVLKERIKSFGFRVWSVEGDAKTGPAGKVADFLVQGEAKVKLLSAKLPASGITVTKTVLTSWTVKAIDRASGEEIYLNTVTPQGKSWASEDDALLDIGKLMGDEFSKGFFLQHFSFGVRRTNLTVTGLPNAQVARLLLRELRGLRQVVDVQMLNENGKYLLQIPEGNAADLVQNAFITPLNTKLGQNCFALAGSSDAEVGVSFSSACAEAASGGKLETVPPAGLLSAPDSRSKPLLKAAKTTT